MQYYRCRCENRQLWTTDGAPQCVICDKCNTTLAQRPSDHQEVAEPHTYVQVKCGTGDDGKPFMKTVCAACHRSKFEIERGT